MNEQILAQTKRIGESNQVKYVQKLSQNKYLNLQIKKQKGSEPHWQRQLISEKKQQHQNSQTRLKVDQRVKEASASSEQRSLKSEQKQNYGRKIIRKIRSMRIRKQISQRRQYQVEYELKGQIRIKWIEEEKLLKRNARKIVEFMEAHMNIYRK